MRLSSRRRVGSESAAKKGARSKFLGAFAMRSSYIRIDRYVQPWIHLRGHICEEVFWDVHARNGSGEVWVDCAECVGRRSGGLLRRGDAVLRSDYEGAVRRGRDECAAGDGGAGVTGLRESDGADGAE